MCLNGTRSVPTTTDRQSLTKGFAEFRECRNNALFKDDVILANLATGPGVLVANAGRFPGTQQDATILGVTQVAQENNSN